jgi:tRNA-dihydrouridine synthase A
MVVDADRLSVNRRFCIAPMMDCSDRHSRFFLRLFSDHILLYTEMVTAAAIVHGDHDRLLGFSQEEHPLAVQLGGSDPELLYRAARICHEYGYDEINLNCGCPSDRVQSGSFGACLMREPMLVADCVAALKSATPLPVTVKHRTGVDREEDYDSFAGFAAAQIDAGAESLIVHARNAWLQGLSPKQNREIPPLKYDWVYRLKRDFPKQEIVVNGGIKTLDACLEHLRHVDGVMLGREPYNNPFVLHDVDPVIFGCQPHRGLDRIAMLHRVYPYIEQQLDLGIPLTRMVRHLMGLFNGEPNARRWRRYLSENAYPKGAGIEVLQQAECLLN